MSSRTSVRADRDWKPAVSKRMSNLFDLTGKNALVTGSHKGLGAAIAIAFAQAGANVAVHGRSGESQSVIDAVNRTGSKAIAVMGDVVDAKVCEETGRKLQALSEIGHRRFIRRLALDNQFSAFLFDALQIETGHVVKPLLDLSEHGAGALLRDMTCLSCSLARPARGLSATLVANPSLGNTANLQFSGIGRRRSLVHQYFQKHSARD